MTDRNAKISIHWQAREDGFTAADIAPGTPATRGYGADGWPATVLEVTRDADGTITRVITARDNSRRGVFLPAEGDREIWTRRADGCLRLKGARKGRGPVISFGLRELDLDPEF